MKRLFYVLWYIVIYDYFLYESLSMFNSSLAIQGALWSFIKELTTIIINDKMTILWYIAIYDYHVYESLSRHTFCLAIHAALWSFIKGFTTIIICLRPIYDEKTILCTMVYRYLWLLSLWIAIYAHLLSGYPRRAMEFY